jgi:hypothetical protein
MGESLLLRAAWAIGALLLFWSVMFFARRVMHRRDSVLQSPETVSWREDALATVPLAWLFAAREVVRAVIERDPPFGLYFAVAIGIGVPLWLVLRNVRRRWQVSRQP